MIGSRWWRKKWITLVSTFLKDRSVERCVLALYERVPSVCRNMDFWFFFFINVYNELESVTRVHIVKYIDLVAVENF